MALPTTILRSRLFRSPALAASAYVALAATDTYLAGREDRKAKLLRRVVKPALMPTLAHFFFYATEGDTSTLRKSVLAAQAFSWGGDVALLGSSEKAFLAGVGSFAGAHVAYTGGMLSVRGDSEDFDRNGLRAAAALWLSTMPVMAQAAGRKDPTLRVPVAGYATLLASMFASSWTTDPELRRSSRHLLRIGASLFLASDTILGLQEFLLEEKDPRLEALVMATYTSAQAFLAAGAAGVVRDTAICD